MLTICTGNICRSPLAEGLLRQRLQQSGLQQRVEVDSAGVIDYHSGEPPDRRAQAAARRRGFSIDDLRARQVMRADLAKFDYLLAMDRGHVDYLQSLSRTPAQLAKIRLMLSFAPQLPSSEVPDPYYGGSRNFELVLTLLEAATEGFLGHLRQHHPELFEDSH